MSCTPGGTRPEHLTTATHRRRVRYLQTVTHFLPHTVVPALRRDPTALGGTRWWTSFGAAFVTLRSVHFADRELFIARRLTGGVAESDRYNASLRGRKDLTAFRGEKPACVNLDARRLFVRRTNAQESIPKLRLDRTETE